MNRLILITLVLFLFSVPAYADIFQDGMDAYERKDYKTALEKFNPLAKQGNAAAQFRLGVMYMWGHGVVQNETEGIRLYKLSAEQGNPEAQFRLGSAYNNGGDGLNLDLGKASYWYHKAAEGGNVDAQMRLAREYARRYSSMLEMNFKEGAKWYRMAAEQGDIEAQDIIGGIYEFGRGVPLDDEEAVKWYRKAAEQGSRNALYHLAGMYYFGRGVSQSYEEAIKLYKKVAGAKDNVFKNHPFLSEGNFKDSDKDFLAQFLREKEQKYKVPAQHNLGLIYLYGIGVPIDKDEAKKWLGEAAKKSKVSKTLLGDLTYKGGGSARWKAFVKSRNLRRIHRRSQLKPALQGDAESQHTLGWSYASRGHTFPKDEREAEKWTRKAAEQGHAEAQESLGRMYYGLGLCTGTIGDCGGSNRRFLRDMEKSFKWYRKAAEQGNAKAQDSIGEAYFSGEGVSQNFKEAVKWLLKSAEQGNSSAQNRLRYMYAKVDAVPWNYHEAMEWLLNSAEKGNGGAQAILGEMYFQGQPVSKDYKKALKWNRLSAEKGLSLAQYLLGLMYAEGKGVLRDEKEAIKWFSKSAKQGGKAMVGAKSQLKKLTKKKIAPKKVPKKKNEPQSPASAPPQPPEEQTPQSGSGSGFFVSKMGHVITNAHVVQNCNKVTIGDKANKQVSADIINTDRTNDLALLKLSTLEMASAESKSLIQKLGIVVVPLASKGLLRSEDVRLGEKVLVAGFPFGDVFSNTIKVTSGIVSATRGAGDDSGQFQLDAAVQPGNSGGPIYDSSGNIVGVVISQLDKLKVAKAIGSLPENVNFGIKASTVRQFLTSSGLPSKKSERTEEKSTEQLAEIAKNQALMVMCLQ